MAKKIQMRKNRFLAIQKKAEEKKKETMNATNAAMNDNGPPDQHGIPKKTVSFYKKYPYSLFWNPVVIWRLELKTGNLRLSTFCVCAGAL